MQWHDLLFAHWPVDPMALRASMPVPLRPCLDVFRGSAWLGIVPFWMSDVGLRGMPSWPRFAECNVRTYVTVDDKPGVYFFSLDCQSLSSVYGARMLFNLPYYYASMDVEISVGDRVRYFSRRAVNKPVRMPNNAELDCEYWPLDIASAEAQPGSLEFFLTERYCLYMTKSSYTASVSAPTSGSGSNSNSIRRAEIHHRPWQLQAAHAVFEENTLAESHGIRLPEARPVFHFAKHQEVLVWRPKAIERK